MQVRATVLEAVGQYELSSTPVNVPFIPAFHVMTPELHVSGMHPHAMLKVSANDRVLQELQVRNWRALSVPGIVLLCIRTSDVDVY